VITMTPVIIITKLLKIKWKALRVFPLTPISPTEKATLFDLAIRNQRGCWESVLFGKQTYHIWPLGACRLT